MSAVQSIAQPRARRVIGVGALAGVTAVAINLLIRGAALAVLHEATVPFPLAVGADVLFTFSPCVLGAWVFLALRREAARPLRQFTVTAAVVLAASWVGPIVLAARDVVDAGALLTLLVMHAVPAATIVVALRLTAGADAVRGAVR